MHLDIRLNLLLLLLLLPNGLSRAQTSRSAGSKFSVGLVSSAQVEYGCTFSNDGTEVYFSRSQQSWGSPDMKSTIYYSRQIDGQWTSPEIASFSGEYDDSDPYLITDGRQILFISLREVDGHDASPDIWVVYRNNDNSWGEPERLPEPITSAAREYSPKLDSKGNLYFASDRPGGYGQGDIYICHKLYGSFQAPVNLGNTINQKGGEWNLEISDDGEVLIFEASGRAQNLSPYGDLYISFKKDNTWSVPQNLEELNSTGSDLSPELTLDNEYLFFSSSDSLKGRQTDIYTLPFGDLLETYREKAIFPENPE